MKILADTHIVISMLNNSLSMRYPTIAQILLDDTVDGFVSVASLWEIAIKTRLGKLDPGMPLETICGYLETIGMIILPIEATHAIALAPPDPATKDPFDRLLLAQCQIEGLKLATMDARLKTHHLAFRA
jgi:PIN domain nuclease of toxin-antitoxin system